VTVIVAMASAFLVGLGPAFHTTRLDLVTSLKDGDRAGSSRRGLSGRSTLVAIQIALSLVLLTIAACSVQLFTQQLAAGPGFRTTQLAKITIDAGQAKYSNGEARTFFARVLREARALPGARSASLTSAMPMSSWETASVARPGTSNDDAQGTLSAWTSSVDDQYFSTMETNLLRGRVFAATDDRGATPVAVVNDTLAAHFWPDGNAVGQRLQVMDGHPVIVDIIGVVATTMFHHPGEWAQYGVYFPYLQRPRGQMTLLVQTTADSASMLQPLGDIVGRLDPRVPTFDLQTMELFYDNGATGLLRAAMRLVTALGVIGMSLTAIGLYSLVSYSVSRRTREIGIRIAVGATAARIIRMVIREGMAPAWIGLPVGLGLSAVTARLLPVLVPVSLPLGAQTFLIAVPLIAAALAVSAFLPARRAAKVNPIVALRCD
jgi:predicted permease